MKTFYQLCGPYKNLSQPWLHKSQQYHMLLFLRQSLELTSTVHGVEQNSVGRRKLWVLFMRTQELTLLSAADVPSEE